MICKLNRVTIAVISRYRLEDYKVQKTQTTNAVMAIANKLKNDGWAVDRNWSYENMGFIKVLISSADERVQLMRDVLIYQYTLPHRFELIEANDKTPGVPIPEPDDVVELEGISSLYAFNELLEKYLQEHEITIYENIFLTSILENSVFFEFLEDEDYKNCWMYLWMHQYKLQPDYTWYNKNNKF